MAFTMELETNPEITKTRPRWFACIIFTTGIIMITVSAVGIGSFIGYTYCYIENRNAYATGNVTQSTNLHIIQMPYASRANNRTINRALMSNVVVSRILQIGHFIWDDRASLPRSEVSKEEDTIKVVKIN
ncbi:uncharacterized protein LOC114251307 [Bombyx mandarina]|uniref:Uncharacterized protein LOC114251307 n=1 Tax=Bombyx mandarina TaxID=7092 RepID=A0A6J2KIE5_BOMMA|nr:uncharacterized protein LOC114251307 [Bombyx mandarina]